MGHCIPTQNVLDRNATQFSLDILRQFQIPTFFRNMAPKKSKASSPTKGAKAAKATTPKTKNAKKSPAVGPENSKLPHCYTHNKVCSTADSTPSGCMLCCYNDKCIHPDHYPRHTCDGCHALFHGAAKLPLGGHEMGKAYSKEQLV